MMGIRHLLNVNWFWWEDVVTTFVMNTVAIILYKAQTLRWLKGLYVVPILLLLPVSSGSGECGNHLPVWLTANVADRWCYIYMTF